MSGLGAAGGLGSCGLGMAPEDPVDMSAEKEGGGERSKSVSSNSSSSNSRNALGVHPRCND